MAVREHRGGRLMGLSMVLVTGVLVMHEGMASHGNDLFDTVDRGDMTAVRLYINANGDPNQTDEKGRSLLSRAAYRGHYNMARALVEAGASVDLADTHGITPMYMACQKGTLELVQLFLPHCRVLNHVDARGITYPYVAVSKGHEAIVKALCQSDGLDINQQTQERGETALMRACSKGSIGIVSFLILSHLDRGIDVNRPDHRGATPLLMSCFKGHTGIVQRLLLAGAKVNQPRDNGITPLIIACYGGNEAIVRLLVIAGADVDYRMSEEMGGGTAYDYALKRGHAAIASYLRGSHNDEKGESRECVLSAQHMGDALADMCVYFDARLRMHEDTIIESVMTQVKDDRK